MVNILRGITERASMYTGTNAHDISLRFEERISKIFTNHYSNESRTDLHDILTDVQSPKFASYMDKEDPLRDLRKEFHLPRWHIEKTGNNFLDELVAFLHKYDLDVWNKTIDFRGNSLGPQPKIAKEYVNKELDIWAKEGHEGHFVQSNPNDRLPRWIYHENFQAALAELLGCKPEEAIQMGTLSANNINLLTRFYHEAKRKGKSKIMIEQGPFPSDYDNVNTVLTLGNNVNTKPEDIKKKIITVSKREDDLIHTEDIVALIEEHKDDLGIIFLGAVNYYSGQLLDIAAIVQAAKKYDIFVGFDFAHGLGNTPLNLHDDGVDFGASCSYKYLNSGPGGPGIAFVHKKNHNLESIQLAAGRWARHKDTRFKFDAKDPSNYKPADGIRSTLISNDAIIHQAPLLASLEVLKKTTPGQLRHKSLLLTGYLEHLLDTVIGKDYIQIITPRNPADRGAQLSFRIIGGKCAGPDAPQIVHDALHDMGIGIETRDDIVRAAPVPLYNTFTEVHTFVMALKKVIIG